MLKLHSLTSPTLHPSSLCGITSNITDIASTGITATTTQRLYCITNNASIPRHHRRRICHCRLWFITDTQHHWQTPLSSIANTYCSNGAMTSLNLASNILGVEGAKIIAAFLPKCT
jgi:hypothetical protein